MSIFKREIEQDLTDMVTGKKLIRRDYRRPGQSEYFYLSKNADGSHNQIDVPDDFGRRWYGKTLPDNVKTTSACLVIDDVYGSEIKNGKVIQRGVRDNEKGYVNRKNDLGGETNFGVTQSSLDEYNNWQSHLKKGTNFPSSVKNLTAAQGKQIIDEMYFQRYGINKICSTPLARHLLDMEVSIGTVPVKYLNKNLNSLYNTNYTGVTISDTMARHLNSLSEKEIQKLNDQLSIQRMKKYFNSVDKYPRQNINNLNGWYDRSKSYHSSPDEFETNFGEQKLHYFNKYGKYYNGK